MSRLEKGDWSYDRLVEEKGEEWAKPFAEWYNGQLRREEELFRKVTNSSSKVMNELFDLINETFGFNAIFNFTVVQGREGLGVDYESKNLNRESLYLNAAFSEIKVGCFNYGHTWIRFFGKDGAKEKHYGGWEYEDIDTTKDAEIGFSIDIHYSYKTWDGGSNGIELGYAFYSEEKGWEIRTEKARRLERNKEDFERQLAWDSEIPNKK